MPKGTLKHSSMLWLLHQYYKLHPMDIPQMKWEYISMDFVTPLPKCQGYDAIFIVVDMLTKIVHLIPMKKEHKAKDYSTNIHALYLYLSWITTQNNFRS